MPAAKTTTRPFSRWRTRAADEGLGHRAHLDGGGDTRRDADVLEGVLEREGVDDGREHAHVVGGGAVHALGAGRQPAEQVAAADHDRGLDAELLDFADVLGDLGGDGGIDPELLLAHQGFTGELTGRAYPDDYRRGVPSSRADMDGRLPPLELRFALAHA